MEDSGKDVVLSRFHDVVWQLWPYFEQSNIAPSAQRIDWSKVPAQFRDECKHVVFRYWTEGNPSLARPIANSVVQLVEKLRVLCKYLHSVRIGSFQQVRPIHLTGFIHHRRSTGIANPATLARYLQGVEILYRFRSTEGLAFEPWPGSSAAAEVGVVRNPKHGTTPVIPQDALRILFTKAEEFLAMADDLLDRRDGGESVTGDGYRLNYVRDACFLLIGLTTGMRCEEIVGIEVGAARTDSFEGFAMHWVRSIEHKTKKGAVEYLMPMMGHRVLAVMERWSQPLRARLKAQLAEIPTTTKHAQRRAQIASDVNRLFLGNGARRDRIRALSGAACGVRMALFAKYAGVDWSLRPHQLRRTYAWAFARHRLGNLLLLKEQFKHSSLSMTQLYAANPQQDDALFADVFNEIAAQKVELIEGWLNSERPLGGRGGERIVKMRAHDFPDRKAMIGETADMVNIRSTGHGWCLAQDEGCGGAGLYEPTSCAGCSDAVIDDTYQLVWQELHAHQLELVDEAKKLGPATVERVARDLRATEAVLADLGWMMQEEDLRAERA
ncbi:tyrosine-type recombinase/integrase [Variovorax sp. LARHSF232]